MIKLEIEAHIAIVRLDRPKKLNALNPEMFEALVRVGDQIASHNEVRCVVLTGEGRAFCAGIDRQRFDSSAASSPGTAPLSPRTHGIANLPQRVVIQWHELRPPVIAAVHGVAFGAGLQIALGADIRYVEPTTQLSVMEVEWGLVPDMGGTILMRNLVREDIVRHLTYTGRIFTGDDAVSYGLATRANKDPLADALVLAREIASKSPDAVQAAKRLLNRRADVEMPSGLLAESLARDDLVSHPNQREAALARLAKRVPHFVDPTDT